MVTLHTQIAVYLIKTDVMCEHPEQLTKSMWFGVWSVAGRPSGDNRTADNSFPPTLPLLLSRLPNTIFASKWMIRIHTSAVHMFAQITGTFKFNDRDQRVARFVGTLTDKETNSRVEWNFIHKTIIIITNFMTGNNTNRNDDDLEN